MHFRPPRPKSDEERVLPLINVVFLLLIFFMLSGKLTATDPFAVTPPHSTSETPAGPEELVVLIGADGQLALDGRPLKRESLESAVSHRLSNGAPVQTRLKADGNAEATQVVAVMEILRQAGVQQLKLLTVVAGQ